MRIADKLQSMFTTSTQIIKKFMVVHKIFIALPETSTSSTPDQIDTPLQSITSFANFVKVVAIEIVESVC